MEAEVNSDCVHWFAMLSDTETLTGYVIYLWMISIIVFGQNGTAYKIGS